MELRPCKTKIVATIGPASFGRDVMERMIRAGMGVARLNFSHGDFDTHARVIRELRAASEAVGRDLAILADLPGPKMRIGLIADEPVELVMGEPFTLTTAEVEGDAGRVSVTFEGLARAVRPGDRLYLNDGLIQLTAEEVIGNEVRCRVVVGGELRSRKGLNLPGIDLGIGAFTERDRECLEFALKAGVDAVSQSFVESAADIEAVRQAGREFGFDSLFVIAKIERAGALTRFEEILSAADGIMIARGDLGVEIPMARIATVQKRLMMRANQAGKPAITATQMLESMTHNRRPTRAEATDVANAILDGTDSVMLSGESAMGRYPVDAVRMLVDIAAATEPEMERREAGDLTRKDPERHASLPAELIGFSVDALFTQSQPAAVIVDTVSGRSARNVTRFRLPTWILARSPKQSTCRQLLCSYGVQPFFTESYSEIENLREVVRDILEACGLGGQLAIHVEGPSLHNPDAIHRISLVDL